MKLKLLVACLATALAMVAITGSPASAAVTDQLITQCGQTLVKNALLTRDLTCPMGLGLITTDALRTLTGDPDSEVNVTLDLGGHRLTGTSLPDIAAFSVYDQDNNPRLTVKNGQVDHWGKGFTSDNCCGTFSIDHVHIDHNDIGVKCGEAQSCTITNSRIEDNAIGTWTRGGLVMTNVVVNDNDVGSTADALGNLTVASSRYLHNTVGVKLPDVGSEGGSADVENTMFARNGVGVKMASSPGASSPSYVTLVKDTFVANGDGVFAIVDADLGDQSSLQGNIAFKNARYGLYAPGATDGGGNKASANAKPCVGVVCTALITPGWGSSDVTSSRRQPPTP